MHRIIEEDCKNIIRELGDDFLKLQNKTLLMTGFSGFLGTYITHVVYLANKTVLRDAPLTLIGLDNFSRGKPEWLSRLEENSNIEVTRCDITEPLPSHLENRDIHFIIHGASIASPTYYRQRPVETMDANVKGLRSLLDYAVGHKGALESFLFFSSSEIYGDPDPGNIPTPETYNGNVSCTGPRACYDESKRYGEALCANFYRAYGLPIKIVRPFNNYGPGLKITDKRVIPDFFRDVFCGESIVLLSDGKATRSFCYISDATTGYFKAMLSGYSGEPFNIGTDGPEISIRDLAQKIAQAGKEVLGKEVGIQYQESNDSDYLTDNPSRRSPDIAKARKLLGFNPGVSLDEGLRRTALWYRDNQTGSEN